MNGTLVFVLLIIAIVMASGLIKTWIKHRHQVPETGADVENMLEKIDVLEERIQVLERIVTEHNIDLRQQIDNL